MTVIHTQVGTICNLLIVSVICGFPVLQVICYQQVKPVGVSISVLMRYSEYSLCGMLWVLCIPHYRPVLVISHLTSAIPNRTSSLSGKLLIKIQPSISETFLENYSSQLMLLLRQYHYHSDKQLGYFPVADPGLSAQECQPSRGDRNPLFSQFLFLISFSDCVNTDDPPTTKLLLNCFPKFLK